LLTDFIRHRILAHLPFEPNKGQAEAIEQFSQFVVSSQPRKAFILRGYAGTGKTSITAALVKAYQELKQPIVLLAPTGRAAKVLARYAHIPAYTIHKRIYRQKKLGEEQFTLNDNLLKNALFIVDEASMIGTGSPTHLSLRGESQGIMFGSGNLLDDLIKFVYKEGNNCSILLIGDDAQLPPVGSIDSPALDADFMRGYGLEVSQATLTEVARQALDSGILANASRVRECLVGGASAYGLEARGERREARGERTWDLLDETEDFCFISGGEVAEKLEQSYHEVGEEEVMMLTRTNKRTNIYNQGIRSRILWREEEVESGDRIMVVKNNYFWTEKYEDLPFLANGDILEINRLRNVREMYGFKFADVQLRSVDYDWEIDAVLWLDTIGSDSPEANNELHRQLFNRIAEDYPELAHSRKKLIETIYQSPYYNALQVRFAYAVTGHKAQGGQWQHVYVDAYKGGELCEEEEGFYRWLYTAITRASKKIYFIKNK
jgi:exodeoxyribonuclease-5